MRIILEDIDKEFRWPFGELEVPPFLGDQVWYDGKTFEVVGHRWQNATTPPTQIDCVLIVQKQTGDE